MNKKILAIFDCEENYACGLMEYLCSKSNLPFEVYIFTEEKIFYSFHMIKEIDFLLISENVYKKDVETLNIPHIVILSESKKNLNEAFHHINKYQSCETIFHEVMKYYTDQTDITLRPFRSGTSKMKILGIYTPIGRCLQTTFSLTLGQMLARKYKTLYLNFEIYSGFSSMLNKNFECDISDLMYYFECAREKMVYRLESMVETINGLDFIPPAQFFHNLAGIRGQQWKDLFNEIEKTSDYEFLILDLSDGIFDLWEVLRNCSKVYTISKGDGLAIAKIEQYEKALKNMEYEDITSKTTKWKLPIFKQLPLDFRELTYGELATYIKSNVIPDLVED